MCNLWRTYLGRRTSITLPDGQTTNYEYDVLDRLTTVYDGTELLAEYEYNANSQLISNVRNDITTAYEYNELGQITQLTTSDINEQLQSFEYQYDKLGNIVEEVRTESDSQNVRTYDYDAANQLVEFSDNDYIEKYAYDSVGNMLSKDINGALTSYAYNEANQLTAETFEQQTITYIYNQNGDLVEKSSGEQYTYDIQGNLTSIIGNGINQSFTYNGNGNRLSKTIDGETTYYVNDLNQRYEQVVQTYNDDGVIDTYTYGLQRIDSKGQTTETYLYDGRGSVTGSVNTDNEFVSYSYTAYGELMPNSPTPTVFGYNAEATDFETDMQYLRARYYDTGVQRFVQEDDYRGSHINPISMNRYMYASANPISYIDPSGYRIVAYGPTIASPKAIPDYVYTNKMMQIEELFDIATSKITLPSEKVDDPYVFLPSNVSVTVYNCLSDIELGKDYDIISLTSEELEELYSITDAASTHYEDITLDMYMNDVDYEDEEYQSYFNLFDSYYHASSAVEDRIDYVDKNYPNGLYSTFDESAIEAYKDTFPISDATKFETGGVFYSITVPDGNLYSYTDSVINTSGNPHSVQPKDAEYMVPDDGTIEGYYHNHVNFTGLSPADDNFAASQSTILTGGMPDGNLHMVDSSGTRSIIGYVDLSKLPPISQKEKDRYVKELSADWYQHIIDEKAKSATGTSYCDINHPKWPN